MQYYVASTYSSNPNTLKNKFITENNLRVMCSCPYYRKSPHVRYAMDNGAFTYHKRGLLFDDIRFRQVINVLLDRERDKVDFIVLPDIIGEGHNSLELSRAYMEDCYGLNRYLPIHKGINIESDITGKDLDNVEGIFFGGDDRTRNGYAENYTRYFQDIGLKVHVGRIGTLKSFVMCSKLGVDSCDSSTLTQKKQLTGLNKYLKFVDTARYQQSLNL